MAIRNIAVTDTIEKFRTEFNAMTLNDFGDIATLDPAITSTTLVGAMNETISIATSTAGWTLEDSSSTQQLIGGGDIVRVLGTSNEIEAVVSATDTLTIGLPAAVTVTTSLTSPIVNAGNLTLTNGSITDSSGTINFGNENLITTGNITAANITSTSGTSLLGTIEIVGNTIRSTDSTQIFVNDSLKATSLIGGDVQLIDVGGRGTIKSASGSNQVLNFDCWPVFNSYISFEGATANNFETDVLCTDPTADRTITIPDATGTIALTNSTGYATSTIFSSAVSLVIYNSAGVAQKTIYGSAS
jgi:hypothetical protein